MKNNNKFRLDVWGAITLGTIALYALFLLYPMAYLIRQSVLDPDTGGFTLAYFTKFFSKSYYFDTLINSFKVSITATVLSIAIGTPLAYLFTIFKIKGKSVLNILIVVASMSAPFIGAYSWILLLGRSGVITAFFKNLGIAIPDIYGFGGIVLVMTLQLFPLVFLLVLGMILFTVVGNLRTWSKNNASPRLTVPATVVAKRMNVSRHHTANAGNMTGAHGYTSTSATTYYVTFQVESGDRMELRLSGTEYGQLAEGDTGKLSFQGTRYLGFEWKDG